MSHGKVGTALETTPTDPCRRRLVFTFLCCMMAMVQFDSGAIPAALDNIQVEFNLNPLLLGLLGCLPYIALTVMCPVAGIFLTTYSPKTLIGIGLGLNVVSLLGMVILPSTHSAGAALLFTSRFLVGLTQASFIIYGAVWVEEFAPQASKTLWVALFQASVPLGIDVGYLASGLMTSHSVPWQNSIWIQIGIMTPMVLIYYFIPTQYLNAFPATATTPGGSGAPLRLSVKNSLPAAPPLVATLSTSDSGARSGRISTATTYGSPRDKSGGFSSMNDADTAAVVGTPCGTPNSSAKARLRHGDGAGTHGTTMGTNFDHIPRESISPRIGTDSSLYVEDGITKSKDSGEVDCHYDNDGDEGERSDEENIGVIRLGACQLSLRPSIGRTSIYPLPKPSEVRRRSSSTFPALSGLFNGLYLSTIFSLCTLFFVVNGMQYWSTIWLTKDFRPEDEVEEDFKRSVVTAFGAVAVTAPILGVLVGGYAIDHIGGYGPSAAQTKKALMLLLLFAVLASACGIGASLMHWGPDGFWTVMVLLWLTLFFGGAIVPGETGVMLTSIPARTRSLASGFGQGSYNIFGYSLGIFLPGGIMWCAYPPPLNSNGANADADAVYTGGLSLTRQPGLEVAFDPSQTTPEARRLGMQVLFAWATLGVLGLLSSLVFVTRSSHDNFPKHLEEVEKEEDGVRERREVVGANVL